MSAALTEAVPALAASAPAKPQEKPKPKLGRPKGSRNKPKQPLVLPAIKPVCMRPEQAAQYLGVSVTTIRRLIHRGALEKRRIGSAIVVLTRTLDAYVESAF
jgi:excisionase family DNA binding protein